MGTIFAVKGYAIHDGPNIRTTIFFKGCPLSCWWCHNPEGIDPDIALVWDKEKCIGCHGCLDHCRGSALTDTGTAISWNRDLCRRCYACVDLCPSLALSATGHEVTVDEVMDIIQKDIPFFDQSGGGVTFSGGEPLLQPEFLLALLRACGRLGLHRTVDTSGFASESVLLTVLPETDLFLFDLKLMDSGRHRLYTGVPNEPIHRNLRLLIRNRKAVRIRLPLIPGINDDAENLKATGNFVASLGLTAIDLLPFHRGAEAKYRKLQRPYKGEHLVPGATDSVFLAKGILEGCGLTVRIGG